ncbi:MAG: ribonuclease T2 [Hyphomonadaceae bacterium]|nr:ribonuclease T2 [Hyphomonadaceae bacterium]
MRLLLIALAALAGAWGAARAQTQPGFDYYVLALSWSPSFCADDGMSEREPRQCGRDRRFSFVVHGLWPQDAEGGWPEHCPSRWREVPPALRQSMLDVMPSPRLVDHQWRKHGQCSGLAPQAYFDLTRRVRAGLKIPAAYVAPERTLMVTGAEVERAFVAANPGHTPQSVAVQCRDNRLREVRLCVTKDGRPRACGPDVRDRCGPQRVAMPPVRAGR